MCCTHQGQHRSLRGVHVGTTNKVEQGRTTTYVYTPPTDNRGRITTKTLPGGFTQITEYYLDGKIKSITGTAQPAEYYDYGVDTSSNCYWTLVRWGSENSSRWKKTYQNMLGHEVKVEKSGYNGSIVTTENFYDQYGNKIKVDKTGEASRLYVYDELGTLIRSGLDVNGNGTLDLASSDRITDSSVLYTQNNGSWWQESSTSVYGISNDAAATTTDITRKRLTGHADNVTQEQIQIDRYGNQTTSQTIVDRNNKKVTQTVTYPDSVIPSERILENALLVSEKSKSGLLYSYSYDGLERKVSSTDPRTGTSTYSYYSSGTGKTGQLQSMTDPAGHVTTYDYEETTGRLKSVKNALNKYTYYSYNSYGQQIYQWGDSVYPVALEYDSLGQKIQQKTYRSGSSWSSPNWPSSENADVTTWSYDASSGLVTSKTDAQNHSVSYTYTSDGKLQTRTWARQAAGQALVTTYTYDNATGELLKADYSDDTTDIIRTYDRLGNLSSVSDAAGTRNFTYNSYFDLTGETLGNRTLSYTYATSGVKGRYTGLTGNHSYGYDAYGRLNQINNVSYSYTANSDLLGSVTRPNEVNSAWTYESHRDLVSSLENQHQTELRSRYAYVNDALGRRTSMSRSGSVFSQPETLNYSYNDRSEVTGATSDVNSAYSYAYSFDPIGNRLSASLAGTVYAYTTTNSLNQYTAVNAVVPTYDADGNMLTNGVWSYTWNGENRLIKAENAASGMKLEFDYDYMGRRIYKKVYEKFLPHINNNYDFAEMLSEMLGELNASHTGARYNRQSNAMPTATLGVFYDDTYTGDGLKVKEIPAKSPLAIIKTKVTTGCVIEQIDGQDIKKGEDYYPLLEGKVGRKIRLTVYNPETKERFEETVRGINASQWNNVLYHRWVERNRAEVERLSGGRLGYVHIQAMNSESFRETYSELLGRYRHKEAVVVDVRHNGGGWLHEDLMILLTGKEYQRFVAQGQYIGSDPFNQWTKPSCMLVCEDNYSNAHGTPQLYKALKVGKLVGAPVPGTMTAVWWETQIDPSLVFGIPQVGCVDMEGRYAENHELEPDVLIYNEPADALNGKDAQLKAAVDTLLKELPAKK